MQSLTTKIVTSIVSTGLCWGVCATEMLLHNVHGLTSSNEGLKAFTHLHVSESGKIVAVGDDLDVPKDVQRVDGGGAWVLPGLIDSHGHIMSLGRAFTRVDLVGTRTKDEALSRVAAFAERNPGRGWITGRGWNQVLWDIKQFPTAGDLDGLSIEQPIFLGRIDGHAAWANSAALAQAGIDNDTPDPRGGEILRDAKGRATGILVDAAMDLVTRHIPPPGPKEEEQALTLALKHLAEVGLTSVHDAGVTAEEVGLFKRFADEGRLTLRVYAMLSGAGEQLDAFDEPLIGYADDLVTVRSIKLYQDGALGSRGAALIQPYTDRRDTKGLAFNSGQELQGMVSKAVSKGFQVNIHAIGDAANRRVLDAFEALSSDESYQMRHRIEHAQIITLGDIPRLAKLGVIASMQPIHATSDMNMAVDRLGNERILGGYAWRRILNTGAIIASGSDFPVEPANPFFGLYAAVSRQDQDGWPAEGWYADQAMTRAEALHSFTLSGAYAAH
ncbi:MAG: amidohydrolase, partial [Pseudomonadota bacterium]